MTLLTEGNPGRDYPERSRRSCAQSI